MRTLCLANGIGSISLQVVIGELLKRHVLRHEDEVRDYKEANWNRETETAMF